MKKALLITAGLIWAAATLTGPAHADALSGGKSAIDAWITTLGGITLSNQSGPVRLSQQTQDGSREAAVHEQGRCRPGRSLYPPGDQQAPAYPQGEDRLRPKHRMPSRPRKDRRPRKAGPVDDRRQGVDQRATRTTRRRRTSPRQSPRKRLRHCRRLRILGKNGRTFAQPMGTPSHAAARCAAAKRPASGRCCRRRSPIATRQNAGVSRRMKR